MYDKLELSILWVLSNSGDGKSTLIKNLGVNALSMDLFYIHNKDHISSLYPEISSCWVEDADMHDEGGNVIGNLQIGQFWINVCDIGKVREVVDIIFDLYDFSKDINWVEGWVPLEIKEEMNNRFKEQGYRVWQITRV